MGSVDVLLNDVTYFLAINVMLLQKHVFLLICCNIEYVVDASRQKNAFALAKTVWLHDICNFLFAVGLVLKLVIPEIHILVG